MNASVSMKDCFFFSFPPKICRKPPLVFFQVSSNLPLAKKYNGILLQTYSGNTLMSDKYSLTVCNIYVRNANIL